MDNVNILNILEMLCHLTEEQKLKFLEYLKENKDGV